LRKTFLFLVTLAACAPSDPAGPANNDQTTQPPPPPPPPPAPTGLPISLTLASGAYWEYFWISESENFAQGSGTTYDVKVGRFRVTLGNPVTIDGQSAFPVTLSGTSSDGTVNFAPEWTHLAVNSIGSLLGSTNGNTLGTIYSVQSTSWSGGGFFVPFPTDQAVTASVTAFPGQYNQMPGIRVGRTTSSGGCTYYPSVGQNICSGDPLSITEREYYKAGVGPLGYTFLSTQTFTGGGFTTSHTNTRTVELVATSFTPTDGSTIREPPWREMASLSTPRFRHSAVALNGKIYVIGGYDQNNGALSSMEIYDPATNTWSAGPAAPVAPPRFASSIRPPAAGAPGLRLRTTTRPTTPVPCSTATSWSRHPTAPFQDK
jgi:hypothetical protein